MAYNIPALYKPSAVFMVRHDKLLKGGSKTSSCAWECQNTKRNDVPLIVGLLDDDKMNWVALSYTTD
eukprot:scaffold1498_cov163-Amphora_coffeaeformis.AAC.12